MVFSHSLPVYWNCISRVFNITWQFIPLFNDPLAEKLFPNITSGVPANNVQGVVGGPGDPARTVAYMVKPDVAAHIIKTTDDFKCLDEVKLCRYGLS